MKKSLSLTIGLFGGSFNPAHAGHVYVSKQACKRLVLNQVWWMISPQNPLKSTKEMATYEARRAHAAALIRAHPQIKLCEIEHQQGLRYTINTLQSLKRQYPQCRFVWLMGGDNLAQFHHWRQWREIARAVPIAVFDRAPFSHTALRSRAAVYLASARIPAEKISRLAYQKMPAWGAVFIPKHPESATRLRNMLGKAAFLAHNEK